MSKKSSCILRRNILQNYLNDPVTVSVLQKCLREKHKNLQGNAGTQPTISNHSTTTVNSTSKEQIRKKAGFHFNMNRLWQYDAIDHKHTHRYPNYHVNHNISHHICHHQHQHQHQHQQHYQPQQFPIFHKPHRLVVVNTSHGLRLKYIEKLSKKSQRLKVPHLTGEETFGTITDTKGHDHHELRMIKPTQRVGSSRSKPDTSPDTVSENFLHTKNINTKTGRSTANARLSEESPAQRIEANEKRKRGREAANDLNANYLRFFKPINTIKSSKPNDRDIIFGNACLLLRKHHCGWEKSRIEWLLQLECNYEDEQTKSCYQPQDNKSNQGAINLRKLYNKKKLAEKQEKLSLKNERRRTSTKLIPPRSAVNTNWKEQQTSLSNICCLPFLKWLSN